MEIFVVCSVMFVFLFLFYSPLAMFIVAERHKDRVRRDGIAERGFITNIAMEMFPDW